MHDRDLIAAIFYYLGRLWEGAPVKLAVAALAAFGGWVTTPGMMQAAIWLLGADWITGMLKARVTPPHIWSSAPLVRGGLKSLIYLGLVLVCQALGAGGGIAGEASTLMGLYLVVTEATSNLENLKAIADRYQVEIPALNFAIRILKLKAEQAQAAGTGPLPTAPTTSPGGSQDA